MAVATIHHWPDPVAGLAELRRVARRVVVLTHDASRPDLFWLNRDYLPELAGLLAGRASLSRLARAAGGRAEPVLIPADCADGFHEACWRRPAAYLDEQVRRGISVWAGVGPAAEERAAACGPTSPPAGGPRATATSPAWRRPAWAFACSSANRSPPGQG